MGVYSSGCFVELVFVYWFVCVVDSVVIIFGVVFLCMWFSSVVLMVFLFIFSMWIDGMVIDGLEFDMLVMGLIMLFVISMVFVLVFCRFFIFWMKG